MRTSSRRGPIVRIIAIAAATAAVVCPELVWRPLRAQSPPILHDTIALTGSETSGPGLGAGATYTTLRAPAINNAGEVAFFGSVSGAGIGPAVIWKKSPAGAAPAALAGPGAAGPGPGNLIAGVHFASFGVQTRDGINLSDAGHVSLAALLTGDGVTTANRDVVLGGHGPLDVIARSAVEDAFGPGLEPGTTFGAIANLPHSLNAAGHVVFYSSLAGSSVTSSDNRGIWTNRSGALELVAREGTDGVAGPGLGPGIVFSEPFAGGANSNVAAFINTHGDIVFRADVTGPGTGSANNDGFWKAAPGGPQAVLRTGDAIGGLGTVSALLSSGATFGFNDAGQLAFAVSTNPGAFDDMLRLDIHGGDPVSLARTGVAGGPLAPDDSVLGGGHHFETFVSDVGPGVLMNGAGEVAFTARYTGPAGTNNLGLFVNSAGVNQIVASTDFDDAILGPGLGSGVEFVSIGTFHVNNRGQVAFEATVDSFGLNAQGLWVWTGTGLEKVAFEGELFDVDPTAGVDLRRIEQALVTSLGAGGNDSRARALNDEGVLAFGLVFEDNSMGIFTATVPFGPADGTPPVITPIVEGVLGSDGRYVSDVTVSWSVVDEESPIEATSGCDPVTLTTDTVGTTFTCTASSAGGTSSASVIIARDTTPELEAFGKMIGDDGRVFDGQTKYTFQLNVRIESNGTRIAYLLLSVCRHDGVRCVGSPKKFKADTAPFIQFSDDPAFVPSPDPAQADFPDTVEFQGTGTWLGVPGYEYRVKATDRGDNPGPSSDTFEVIITAPDGTLITSGGGTVHEGTVESKRPN